MTTSSTRSQDGRAEVGRLTVWAGSLLVAGLVLSVVAELFHPSRQPANDHPAVFTEYAASTGWLWVHYAQFTAAAIIVAGFLVLTRALGAAFGDSALQRVTAGAAAATAALIAVNMAVDGVALKNAVDAWAAAPEQERAARFAAAEVVRWLEWGANSFFQILLGSTLVLSGVAISRTALAGRWLGWVTVAAGVCLIAGGVLVGHSGFTGSPTNLIAYALFLVAAVGLLITGLRSRASAAAIAVTR
jgi:Domain of unknown function (DUF4386)